ncbi:MAG: DUF87 domain-containing protein [Ruminococcus sp.]|nr:DUF87 domain-containing protein [Ruminococcus sp.]
MGVKILKKSAKEIDKERVSNLRKEKEQNKKPREKRKIKRTTMQTMPYEYFVSNYICLLKSNVKIGKETTNLYSKTYLVPDINYSALTREQQLEKLQLYIELLNGFDSSISLQVTILNTQFNKEEFKAKILLKNKNDGLNEFRNEFNEILQDNMMQGQNGMQCRKFITVTVSAINFETASTRFFNIETHLINCLEQLGTELITLNANDRVRLMADILRDVNAQIHPISREEFARKSEKLLCCPDYFEFKKDYFMYNDKFARCIYFKRLPTSVEDTIFKDIVDMNQSLIISKNVEFVEPTEAFTMLQRKITDMKQEEIDKVRKAAQASHGAFIDPIEGTQLAIDKAQAQEFLQDLQERNQKMTLCQFIIMLTANSYEELQKNTEALEIILRKHQIEPINASYRQEQAFSSVLPLGNSFSCDKEHNIQVRRTLSSESTAVFMPFNARELLHEGGLYYGLNKMTKNIILFDRRKLKNPNGFVLGVPGSGKSFLMKLEILFALLATKDEILILDPEREYGALVEFLGGEVIYISPNSETHINPLDLTENPDKEDKEYDPIKAKLDFLLSFFSAILGNSEINPIQKTIIDNVMHSTYKNHQRATLKEYYEELQKYEENATDETKSTASYLRQALHLYVHGSMNVFSNESNVNINKRIVVYDIKDLGKNLQTVGMTIVLENLWDKVAKNRLRGLGTRIYIDEMYLLFKSEQSANFFYELYKRARKWGGVPTGITQNVEDLLRSEMARSMLSNTQFVVMLSQNATDREQLARLLKISPETMRYVTNAGAGKGLIYADEYGTIPFENKFPTNTKIYSIISTKFGENLNK